MSPLPYLLLLLSISVLMSSCARPEGWSEADWKLAQLGISPEQHALGEKKDLAWKIYIYNVLYVGMPETEFVQQFRRTGDAPEKPYIIQQQGFTYTILKYPTLGNEKARVTFRENKLSRYEQYVFDSNPFGYTDCTFLLRPAKDVPAAWER